MYLHIYVLLCYLLEWLFNTCKRMEAITYFVHNHFAHFEVMAHANIMSAFTKRIQTYVSCVKLNIPHFKVIANIVLHISASFILNNSYITMLIFELS
jgi:hypothetical protein